MEHPVQRLDVVLQSGVEVVAEEFTEADELVHEDEDCVGHFGLKRLHELGQRVDVARALQITNSLCDKKSRIVRRLDDAIACSHSKDGGTYPKEGIDGFMRVANNKSRSLHCLVPALRQEHVNDKRDTEEKQKNVHVQLALRRRT